LKNNHKVNQGTKSALDFIHRNSHDDMNLTIMDQDTFLESFNKHTTSRLKIPEIKQRETFFLDENSL